MKATDCRLISIVVLACAFLPAAAAESPKSLLDFYASEAKASDPGFSGFSAERGEHLFRNKFSTGKPDTPSCTTCHTTDATKTGQTRAGKDIEPMAASANPSVTAIGLKRKNGLEETATTSSAETVPRRKRVTS
jgi:cytochrome c peroxidase